MSGSILYATSHLVADTLGRRIARQRQSSAARQLLETLEAEIAPTARSKSHSRTMVAAAVGNVAGLSLGIDIEWMAPDRPFAAMTGIFLKAAPAQIGMEEFYRGWTFAEAYFKALQHLPRESDIQNVAAGSTHDGVLRLSDATNVLQRRIDNVFQLCVVWHAPALQSCSARYIPIGMLPI